MGQSITALYVEPPLHSGLAAAPGVDPLTDGDK